MSRHAHHVSRASPLVLSLGLVAAFSVLAAFIGLALPAPLAGSLIEEGGPVESLTVLLYLVAVAALAIRRLPVALLDKTAVGVVLLACAAREADLHKELFGMSILKARFYTDFAAPWQIAVALGALLPVVAAVGWLLVARRRAWFVRPAQWTPPVATAVAFIGVLVLSKVLDRLPDTLIAWHLAASLSDTARLFLQAEEELLELALPLLALCGIFLAGRPDPGHDRTPA